MTDTEKLKQIADELRHNLDNQLDLAIFTLVDMFANVGDSNIISTCGNIGIILVKDSIFLTNLDTGEIIFSLSAEIE